MTSPKDSNFSLMSQFSLAQSPTFAIELAEIKELDSDGCPLIFLTESNNKESIKALTQVRINKSDIGKPCTVAFIGGDQEKPVIMGLLYSPEAQEEPLLIESEESIILKSGQSTIELHANGRIHLQGMHISSQAYGPNQLKGASVKIN